MGAAAETKRPSRAGAFGLAALVLVAVAGIDQATKALAVASLAPGESESVFFAIDLAVSRNTGIAFGALAGAADGLIAALVGVALAALLVFFVARARQPLLWLPVGMVLGGAVGNLIDRARIGAVVDFIDPSFWPAFNLADTAIVVGILGVLYVAEGRPGEGTAEQGQVSTSGAPGRGGA